MTQQQTDAVHSASAKALNLDISTKQSVEISHVLRYRSTSFAKKFLEGVVAGKQAVPMKKYNRDTGHKVGRIAAGKFPQKAAGKFLKLVKAVEANAQNKGLNADSLKITKLVANKASTPLTGGRHRQGTKRTHIEIEVKEGVAKKEAEKRVQEEKKTEVKKETPVAEKVIEKKAAVEEKKVETKAEPVVEKKEDVIEEAAQPAEEKVEPVAEPVVEEKKEEPVQEEKPAEPVAEVPAEIPAEEKPVGEAPVEEKREAVVEKPAPVMKEVLPEEVAAPAVEPAPVEELSSEALLARAQAKAAELNKVEEKDKNVEEVSSLFEQLQKKGTLRDDKDKK